MAARTSVRNTVDGSAKNPKKSRLRTPCGPSSVEVVRTLRAASPGQQVGDRRSAVCQQSARPWTHAARSPRHPPAGWRRAAARSASRYHRKAGMLSLSPWRMPAWEADVCDGSRTDQGVMRCEPDRTQRAMCGALPVRIAKRSSGSARPSTCTMTRPGGIDPGSAGPLRTSSSTTARYHESAQSRSSTNPRTRFTTARYSERTNAHRKVPTSNPGSSCATSPIISPLMSSDSSPNVRTA